MAVKRPSAGRGGGRTMSLNLLIVGASIAIAAILVGTALRARHSPPVVPPSAPPPATAAEPLDAGDAAPDFTLPDAHGGSVTLSQLTAKKPVLLVFFLGYECPRCVRQLRELAQRLDGFDQAGAQIVAISPEPVADVKQGMMDFGDFPFPLLSDENSRTAAVYGLTAPNPPLLHGMFIIDTHNRIRFAMRSDHPYDNVDALLVRLKQAATPRVPPRPPDSGPDHAGPPKAPSAR